MKFDVVNTRYEGPKIEEEVLLSINNNIIPPTINHKNFDDKINPNLNFTFGKAQNKEVNFAMSNTFGFGGHNACIIFKKIK